MKIESIEKNYAELIDHMKKSLEKEIEGIKKAKEEKSLEKRTEALEKEIEQIKKFLADDGYTKELEKAKGELNALEERKNEILVGKPTLVDFWAAWCAPCRMIGQVVHQLEEDNKGKLNVVKVDTETKIGDELFRIYAEPNGVNAIPYLLVFDKDGNLSDSLVGANPAKLTQMVQKVLK